MGLGFGIVPGPKRQRVIVCGGVLTENQNLFGPQPEPKAQSNEYEGVCEAKNHLGPMVNAKAQTKMNGKCKEVIILPHYLHRLLTRRNRREHQTRQP